MNKCGKQEKCRISLEEFLDNCAPDSAPSAPGRGDCSKTLDQRHDSRRHRREIGGRTTTSRDVLFESAAAAFDVQKTAQEADEAWE